jgi:TRAP-type C4-dicarboxylate transport system substrate-binding protein
MISFFASKRSWDRMPPDLRKALEEIGSELTVKGWDLAKSSTSEGIEQNKKKGMSYVALRPEWKAPIRDAVQKTVLPGWIKRTGADGKAAYNDVLAPFTGIPVP